MLMRQTRFANVDALTEIHRVLAPGAFVGVIWNIEDCACLLPRARPLPANPVYLLAWPADQPHKTTSRPCGPPRPPGSRP